MAGKKNIHVVRHPKGGWTTRKAKSKKTGPKRLTQKKAIDDGRKQAKKNKSELVIHRVDGKFRDKDSYGPDPCPPKDKKH